VPDQATLKRLRQARRRLRHRQRNQARRLLDDAYQAYRRELRSPQNDSYNGPITSPPLELIESVDSPSSLVHQSVSPPCPCTPPPDSPHSVLILRVRPDTLSRTPSISPPSYSPIQSPRPISPTNSTSSVEFIDKVRIPPPRPRNYYYYDPNESLETLIIQFPQRTDPLPSGSYTIGLDDFDLAEIREIVTIQDPDSLIPVYLSNSPFPYNVPVRFFYNLFPPFTITINEIIP